MKNRFYSALTTLGVSVILAASSPSARADQKLIVNVPFDFVVMNHQMEAGTYDVTTDLRLNTVLIRAETGGPATFAISFAAQAPKTVEQAKLVFRCYGDRYFLAQVWGPGTNQGRELNASEMEQEIARNTGKPETVALLASAPKLRKATH